MVAVANGYTDCSLLLLSVGARVDLVDVYGRSALHRASANGHEECVDALLHHQANPSRRDCNGSTPMHMAAMCGHVGTFGSLLQAGGNSTVLDRYMYTPLHWACYNGHDNCVELLVEGEEVQSLTGNIFSPIHCAALNDNDTCAELLVDTLGSSILELMDKKGRTPLHTAVYGNHIDCVQFFLNHKANAECPDTNGQTPLLIASSMGHTRVLNMLIQGNADAHAVDEEGNTSLHLACSGGHSDCGLTLVRQMSDAYLSAQNLDGRTPLHLASANGLVAVVHYLLSRNVNCLAQDSQGFVPALSCAGSPSVAQCLYLILEKMMPSLIPPIVVDLPNEEVEMCSRHLFQSFFLFHL